MTQSEESITRMTSYRLPHHGNRSFAAAQDDILRLSSPQRQTLHIRLGWQLTIFLATSVQILHVRSGRRLTFPSLWRLFLQLSFWTGARMLFEKDGKRNSNTEWRIYYSDDVLPSSSPRVYKSFTFVQDDDWRFPHYDALPSPVILNGDKNSIWERQGSGTVTQSEESITLMTSCR